MKEGSLEAPTRHRVAWDDPEFYNAEKLDAETRRVFDICHGCRRCFNLCESFPQLFDLIDESPTGELDAVSSQDFDKVVDNCTLCDMCFMTKCPYVPPHEFNLDFPHLMLRHRIVNREEKGSHKIEDQLAKTDRNGELAGAVAPLANWGTKIGNSLTRPLMEKTLKIHRDAKLPQFHSKTLVKQAQETLYHINPAGPAVGEKAVIYATCYGNYNNPELGLAARAVLAHNGVEVKIHYPECCGMPLLEQGDVKTVVEKAHRIAKEMKQWIDDGYVVIGLIPSCALMIKQEWKLLIPEADDRADIDRLADHTYDISEYVVYLQKKYGLTEGLSSFGENITLHLACHSRAQNIGQKAAEMLRLIPDTNVSVIERCSGHGGSWGMMVDHYETGLKIGKPAMTQAKKLNNRLVLSECPLAGEHLIQGLEKIAKPEEETRFTTAHPIEIFAKAYGLLKA